MCHNQGQIIEIEEKHKGNGNQWRKEKRPYVGNRKVEGDQAIGLNR
jgi:hypothetical protein